MPAMTMPPPSDLYWLSYPFAAILWVLVYVNRRIGGSFLYPPVVYTTIWATLLSGVAIAESLFFAISLKTHAVYLVGAASFSAGGALYVLMDRRRRRYAPPPSLVLHASVLRIIKMAVAALIILAPLYWRMLQGFAQNSPYGNSWTTIRAITVRLADSSYAHGPESWSFVIFSNVVTFASLLSLIAMAEGGRSRGEWLAAAALLLATIAYSVMMATAATTASLLTACAAVISIRKRARSLDFRIVTAVVAAFLIVFLFVSFAVSKGHMSHAASFEQNAKAGAELVAWYALGGVVAFDRVVADPTSMPASWSISRFFLLTANKLGASFAIPSSIAPFTWISPTMYTNVYTGYFSYYRDYGFPGVVILSALIGFVVTLIYQAAVDGWPEMAVLYGLMFSGMVLSGFGEGFFLALNTIIKGTLMVTLVFSIQRWWFRRRIRRSRRRISGYGPVPAVKGHAVPH